MSANITLQGKVYSNVPSVILPTSGGGTATFTLNGEGGANVVIPYKSATITLTTSAWSSSNLTQTVTVQGVTNGSNIFVTPAQTNYNEYMLYGIQCTSQGINSLTFTCSKIPSGAIIVNVMVISDDGSGTTVSNNGIVTSISVDLIYPVGSYYWSSTTTSPASLFGGTWTRIKNSFLWAMGDSGTIGATGGNSSVTLTKNNIPPLDLWYCNGGGTSWPAVLASTIYLNSDTTSRTQAINAGTTAQAFSIMPPYINAYCWKRTA